MNINKDFYPTPKEITREMTSMLDYGWRRKYKYILEPSAGKGDLIENFKSILEEDFEVLGRKHNVQSKLVVDVVEIDDNLINILRGKGYNVAFNDFLKYQPQRYYDLILANFPFSNGVDHFLKAIEIQGRTGGDIIGVINAETIRNTYSKERKLLKHLLEEYKAEIKFIENGFSDAERETDVEIAIVFVQIPIIKAESMFEREFKRENPQINFEDMNAVTVKMNKLQQLVFEYELTLKSVIKLFEEELKVKQLLGGFGLNTGISLCREGYNAGNIDINEFINDTNKKFWDKFIHETNFETRLPSKLKDNFRSNMQKQENIAFNMENVQYFCNELMKAIPRSYEETIGDLFDKLTRKWNYTESEWNKNIWGFNGWKSNNAFSIQKKVIIPCHLTSNFYSSYIPDELLDLNIAFNNITGITDEESFMYNSDVVKRIANAEKKIESTHFILNSYKKGTLHVEFKDKKALAQFNLIGAKGKNWINEEFTRKEYSDMTNEEKEIVKGMGFEPCEFEMVTGNSNNYLLLMA